ncbi:MAG: hypothetical protein PVJ75_03105 [Chloroflexota bacterium]|jgi:hypothetical protein
MHKVDDHVKRTYRYFYDDGLVEIAVGLLMIAVGAVLLARPLVTSSTLRSAILVVILPAMILGGMFLIKWFVQKAKERVTYERTGYVAYRQGEPTNSRWFLIIALLLLFGIMLILPEAFSRTQFVVGYFFAVFLGYLGFRLGLRRFYGIGVVALLIGLVATIMFSDEAEGIGLTIGGAGLLLLLSGALTLFRYLRRHPEPRNVQA